MRGASACTLHAYGRHTLGRSREYCRRVAGPQGCSLPGTSRGSEGGTEYGRLEGIAPQRAQQDGSPVGGDGMIRLSCLASGLPHDMSVAFWQSYWGGSVVPLP